MKKYLQSSWVRVLSTILCAVFVVNLGVGIFGYALVTEFHDIDSFREEGYNIIAQNYGLYAIDMMEQGKEEELQKEFAEKQINCSIQLLTNEPGENGEIVSTTETKLYVGNFGDEEAAEIEVVPGAECRYRVNSLLGILLGYTYYAEKDEWVQYPITGYVYSVDSGLFYYKTPIGYFPVEYVYVQGEDLKYDYKLVHKDGKSYYYNSYYQRALDTTRYQEWVAVDIDGYSLAPSIHEEDLEYTDMFVYVFDGLPAENEIWTKAYKVAGGEIYCPAPEYTDYYQVKVSCEEEAGDSLFVQMNELCSMLVTFEGSAIWMIVSSVIAVIVLIVLIICSAKSEKEQMNFMEKVPVCIYSGSIFMLVCGAIMLLISIGEWFVLADSGSIFDLIAMGIPMIILTVWLAVNWFQNIVTRIKCKSFWKTTEVYYTYKIFQSSWGYVVKACEWCWDKISKPFKAIGKACRKVLHVMGENVPLFWGGIVLFVVISFIELVLCVNGYWHEGMYVILYIIFKILETLALAAVLYYMQQLHEGSKRVASGDMSQPIDTSKMVWKFKEHAENINKVSDGIAVAVEERMKSEHFKTELITNVSHDIKTPLTSIINYVDLIKKEDIEDEKVREYVDVLDRQSARLKKLIEDLMEASKASTGNLTVNWEECDLDVLLTQVIGEFEERLEKKQLAVVVDKPEHQVKIKADGRHIWRVFDNLLNNACNYSLPGTRVYVTLKQEAGNIKITFKNISKEALNIPSEELMERFVRGDSSRNTEGSGLGLSIAQSLTELMKGNMKLDIDGDLFKVTLTFPAISKK